MQATVSNIQKLNDSDIQIIDIRLEYEWVGTGIVENSHTITFFDEYGGYDVESFLEKIKAITPNNKEVALICRTASRTGMIAPFLEEQLEGYTVHDLEGGIVALARDGYQPVPFIKG